MRRPRLPVVRHSLLLLSCVSASLLTTPVAVAQARSHTTPAAQTQVPLNLVAAQVARTLDVFNAEAESRALPKLSKVVFDFNAASAGGGGFSFNLLVFHLGANRSTTYTNEVTFTYAVPRAPAAGGVLNPRGQPATHDFSQSLLATLQAAAAQVRQTQSIGAAKFSDVTVTLSYGVIWDVSGGAGGVLGLVTLDGSVDRKRSDVQTIALSFGL